MTTSPPIAPNLPSSPNAPSAIAVAVPLSPTPSPTGPAWSGFAFVYLAWVTALGAALGSLFFSEVMKLPPCTLCWYQRICIYPLVLILPVGIVMRDVRVSAYALPLVVVGFVIAAYHNLLYYGVIAEPLVPCTAGVPCTSRQIDWFGFVGIPLLGLLAFIALFVLLGFHQISQRRRRKDSV